MPRKSSSQASQKTATAQPEATWRLAVRTPIRAYDDYFDEEIELEIGQRDPHSIEGLLIDFRYIASDGEVSRRSVLCCQCGRNGNRLYVRGYCAFREELRTFRIDRMSDLIAIQGEHEIQVGDIVGFFAAFTARETREHDSLRLKAPD